MNNNTRSILDKIIANIAGVALLAMTFIVAINSISRYCFNKPLTHVEEVATSLFVWLIFIGASVCYKEKMHIGVEVFVEMLPERFQKVIEIIVDFILIAANILLIVLGSKLTYLAWSKLTPVLRIPYSFIDAAAVFGFFMCLIYSIEFLISDLKKFSEKPISMED